MSERNDAAAAAPPALDLERVFDAPRALVFEAWSTAAHLSKWFAPKPLVISACDLEFHSGGKLTFTMRGPDGSEFPFVGKFGDIVPSSKIMFVGDIGDGTDVHTTVTFEDAPGGKTKLSVHQTYSKETESTRGAHVGWASTLDNLAEVLAG